MEKKILVVKDMSDGSQVEIEESQIFNHIVKRSNTK